MKNAQCSPQGVFIRHDGLEFIAAIPPFGSRLDGQDTILAIECSFSDDENYLIVFIIGVFYVLRKEDTGKGSYQFVDMDLHPYSNKELDEVVFEHIEKGLVLAHPDHPARYILKDDKGTWASSLI